jgi:hypothetical protein
VTSPDQALIVGGSIELRFRHLGADPSSDGPLSEPVTATFMPLGDEPAAASDTPHESAPGETNGVYEARAVSFGEPGAWEVQASVELDGETEHTTGVFSVAAEHEVAAPGEPAPRSTQALAGASGVSPSAIDSRATDGVIPDPLLHQVTVADAVDLGKPTVVVISTPVYCVSRFCGPITDVVDRLAETYAGRASFVHLEVWRDFEANELNPAAAEWVVTSDGGAEPWVFLIDSDGTVVRRWDNVTNGDDLEAALTEQIARTGG